MLGLFQTRSVRKVLEKPVENIPTSTSPLSKSLITVTLLHFGLVSLVCVGRSHCSDLVWKNTDSYSFRTGASETFPLNYWRVITNRTIVAVALLEDTEIIEDQMLVASDGKVDKEQKDHEENKVERI